MRAPTCPATHDVRGSTRVAQNPTQTRVARCNARVLGSCFDKCAAAVDQETPKSDDFQPWKRRKRWNQNQSSRIAIDTDATLAENLMHLLQKLVAQKADDRTVIEATSHMIQNQSNGSSMQDRREFSTSWQDSTQWNATRRWQKHSRMSQPKQQSQPVTKLVEREWKLPPKLCSYKEVIASIKEGKQSPPNLVEIQTKEICTQIRTLWHSYGCTQPLTLLLTGEARHSIGATATRIRVARGTATFHIEEVALISLGDQGNWTQPAVQVDCTKIKTIPRSTIRILAPMDYRSFFLDSHKDLPKFVLAAMVTWSDKVRASNLTGGKWTYTEVNGKQLLAGWLTLPTDMAVELIPHSGQNGVFAHIHQTAGEAKAIKWIQKTEDQSLEACLQDALRQAKGRKTGLYFRKSVEP